MDNNWETESETAEFEAPVATPRFASDTLEKSPLICKAFAVSLPDQLKRWRVKSFPQKLDSLLLNFVCSLTQLNKEIAQELDFNIWFYGIDSDGIVTPSFRDYNRLWQGRRLSAFYIVVSANTGASSEVAEAFEAYLQGKKVQLIDTLHLSDLPEGAFPLYRFTKGSVIEYVERVCLDPALGKVPAYVCPVVQNGWIRYAWMAVDLDKCVRQALAAGKAVGRPVETITCNGVPSDFKVELRTWNWETKWTDCAAQVHAKLKLIPHETKPKTMG